MNEIDKKIEWDKYGHKKQVHFQHVKNLVLFFVHIVPTKEFQCQHNAMVISHEKKVTETIHRL